MHYLQPSIVFTKAIYVSFHLAPQGHTSYDFLSTLDAFIFFFVFSWQIVEELLNRSHQHHIHEAVLQAISAGHIQISKTILKHRRYLELWRERQKLGDTDGFYKTAYTESQFSPDMTPLILASRKNQYEIVQVEYNLKSILFVMKNFIVIPNVKFFIILALDLY